MRESYKLQVKKGVGRALKTSLGSSFTRSDGSDGVFVDRAIPSLQFVGGKTNASNRAVALPREGFMYVNNYGFFNLPKRCLNFHYYLHR
jgi:hypothetical protein